MDEATKSGPAKRYADEYRSWVPSVSDLFNRVDAEWPQRLEEAAEILTFFETEINHFMLSLNLESVPDDMREFIRERTTALLYHGFCTHCVLFRSPHRLDYRTLDREQLNERWLVQSLTAESTLRLYDRDSAGCPKMLFDRFYSSFLEPPQRQLGLGWWRRSITNRTRFLNFYASGIVFGMLLDMETKKMAAGDRGQ